MKTADEIGETLDDIRSQLLVARGILSKVDDMYDDIRDDMIKGMPIKEPGIRISIHTSPGCMYLML